MREILFRGKRLNNGKWVEGYFFRQYGSNEIITVDSEIYHVAPESVGQYTGLKDKNGKRIFEGDIVDVLYNPRYGGVAKQRIGIRKVVFEEGCFMMEDDEGYLHFIASEEVTVVGNIYDNPELKEE